MTQKPSSNNTRDSIIRRTEKFLSRVLEFKEAEARDVLLKMTPEERLVVLKLYRLRNLGRARREQHRYRMRKLVGEKE